MRLLHTKDLVLKTFTDANCPPYAILSHTWEDEELSFGDVQTLGFQYNTPPAKRASLEKLKLSCKQAQLDRLEWIWNDTCCIDKSSSAELTESINSMYKWYAESDLCYAFMVDVTSMDDLKTSRWFRRGWTLQELIAPRTVLFYSVDWNKIAEKREIRDEISAITGIPQLILDGRPPEGCNVAQRLSWASNRETTREEDMAYCLLGLFDVAMPPIYGEGLTNAFLRLQDELLKRTADQTLFLWTPTHEPYNQGLLATSPQAFCNHRKCFQWLPGTHQFPNNQFDPYQGFKPMSDFVQSLVVDSVGNIKTKEHSQGSFPSVGANGTQISFLMTSSSQPSQDKTKRGPQMALLDLLYHQGDQKPWGLVGLNLQPENYYSTSFSLPNRIGSMRRYLCSEKPSQYTIEIRGAEFARKQVTISQVKPPLVFPDLVFPFRFSQIPTSILTPLPEVHLEGADTPSRPVVTSKFFQNQFACRGGAIAFAHNCRNSKSSQDSAFFFGAHGRRQRPSPWCHVVTKDTLALLGYDINMLKKAYWAMEMSSGRFGQFSMLPMACSRHTIWVSIGNTVATSSWPNGVSIRFWIEDTPGGK
jgi:hypothetical protein